MRGIGERRMGYLREVAVRIAEQNDVATTGSRPWLPAAPPRSLRRAAKLAA
jgi:hypothetical protein